MTTAPAPEDPWGPPSEGEMRWRNDQWWLWNGSEWIGVGRIFQPSDSPIR